MARSEESANIAGLGRNCGSGRRERPERHAGRRRRGRHLGHARGDPFAVEADVDQQVRRPQERHVEPSQQDVLERIVGRLRLDLAHQQRRSERHRLLQRNRTEPGQSVRRRHRAASVGCEPGRPDQRADLFGRQ